MKEVSDSASTACQIASQQRALRSMPLYLYEL